MSKVNCRNMASTSFKLEKELFDTVNELGKKEDRTFSAIVRLALKDYVRIRESDTSKAVLQSREKEVRK